VFETQEIKKDRPLVKITIPIPQSTIHKQIHHFKTTFHIFNTLLTHKYIHFKTTFITGVSSSQALPGFLVTAPPSVCVPAVLGALAVWIQKKKKIELK